MKTNGFLLFIVALAPATAQVLPHVAVGGNYTTEFLIMNTGSANASVTVSLYDDTGKPMTVNFPGLNGRSSGFQNPTIAPNGSIAVVADDAFGAVRGGSAVVSGSAGIIAQAIFRSKAADGKFYEASVPAVTGSTRFTMPFDATTFTENGAQIYTGVAVTNLSSTKVAAVTCTATSSDGATIPNSVIVPPLQPLGHWADYLFPALIGKRGVLNCVSDTNVAAIGLRFLGNYAFSSLTVAQSTAPANSPGTPVSSRVVGHWTNQITQTTVSGAAVPPRQFSVSLIFQSDGTYSYSVMQSDSPAWQMNITGKFVVSAAPPNNQLSTTQVALMPQNVSITGVTGITQTSELSRLAFEGFPGTANEAFLVTWDGTGVMSMKNENTTAHSCSLYPTN